MSDKTLCLTLYREAFGEEDLEFENALFDICFKYCKFIKEENKIISMLFLLPTVLETETQKIESYYIYAAATLKEYRGKGYMAKLLESIKAKNPIFLRPANDGLIKFYEKFGFQTVKAQKNIDLPRLNPAKDFLKLTEKFSETENGEIYTAMYFSVENLNLKNLNFIYTME